MADNDQRGADRVPAALRVKLRYPDVASFIDRYAVNVSRGGIFIASRNPKPVGSRLRFEFQLADGSPVVRGEGQVVWVKEFDPAQPRKPHGMGLKFTRLDARSKAILDRMLAAKGQGRTDGSGPLAVEGSAPRPLPPEGSGPQVLEESAPHPVPAAASQPQPAEESAPHPVPAAASQPQPAEESAPHPAPAAEAAPRFVPVTPTPPTPPPPRPSRRRRPPPPPPPPSPPLAAGLQRALDELERLVSELGLTDEIIGATLARARELAAGANGELAALLGDSAAATPPPPPHQPRPPLPPGAAQAAAHAPSFDQEETTDVDLAQRATGKARDDDAR
jgi:uncharacterized protein (TIGR02266 family)